MKDWIWIVLIVVAVVIYEAYQTQKRTGEEKPGTASEAVQYQAKYLLTKYEWKNYIGLRSYAAAHDLIICPKIRLADLVEPKKGTTGKEWHKLFNRIKAKHVDFVLCDPDMRVKLIIELDDSSHDRQDRKERDAFVDAVLTGASYQICHLPRIDAAALAAIDNTLNPKQPEEPAPPAGGENPPQGRQ